MSIRSSDLERIFGVASQSLSALEVVGDAASSILSTVGKDSDAAVMTKVLAYLKVVIAVTDAVSKSLQGGVDPSKIAEELATLRSSIQANDAAANASLSAKFDPPQ